MELEPISDSSQWKWCFHNVGGGVDPRELGFLPPFVKFWYVLNDPWTGDGTLSSPGGAGSMIYEPQPIRDRSVGGTVEIHTVRGGINHGDISVIVPGLSELNICEWIMILGMDPIVPRLRLLYVRSPANERPAIRQKGHNRNIMFLFLCKTRSSLKLLTLPNYLFSAIAHY